MNTQARIAELETEIAIVQCEFDQVRDTWNDMITARPRPVGYVLTDADLTHTDAEWNAFRRASVLIDRLSDLRWEVLQLRHPGFHRPTPAKS